MSLRSRTRETQRSSLTPRACAVSVQFPPKFAIQSLKFYESFALKPKVNAVPGKLSFIRCLFPSLKFPFTVQFPTKVCTLSSQILRKLSGPKIAGDVIFAFDRCEDSREGVEIPAYPTTNRSLATR